MLCSSGSVGSSRSRALAARLAARRLQGVSMFMRGVSQAEVARRLGVTREAVRQWIEAWKSGGPAALAARPRVRRRRVELARISEALARAHRASSGALSGQRVLQIIGHVFGVKYCASSARAILHALGFSYTRRGGWVRSGVRQVEAKRRAS
jgi:transposase